MRGERILNCTLDVINEFPCPKGFRTGRRFFPYPYFLYVHRGTGIYTIGERRYLCREGDFLYCPPGVCNVILADEQDPFCLSGLETTLTPAAGPDTFPATVNLLQAPFCIRIIREMIREYSAPRIGSAEICSGLLQALLGTVVRLAGRNPSQDGCTPEALAEYLADPGNPSCSVSDLEKLFHFHRNTLNRMIRKATGMSLGDYRIALRIQRARTELTWTDKTVSEISEELGYSSPSFFILQFRQKTGQSPGEFRAKNKTARPRQTGG